MNVFGYGVEKNKEDLKLVEFNRPDIGEKEVSLKVTHCGVCHSDVHQVRDEWQNTNYPCVPGHEIVGEVTEIGSQVGKFKVGDRIGVGCMINSCQNCEKCKQGLQNYCQGPKGCTLTYNGTTGESDVKTYGGYSTNMVVNENFGIHIPESLASKFVGPIMCAGITVYSPMKKWNLKKGQTLGVLGIGGLGHMAIKLGKALDAKVIAFTRSEDKILAIKDMGADEVVISKDEGQMKDAQSSVDLMINTIPVAHDISQYFPLMKTDSTIVIVGNLIGIPEFQPGPMVFKRISIAGSLIGGIEETQEVVDLCGKHEIKPNIKMINVDQLNSAFQEIHEGRSDSYRHVIDIKSLQDLTSNSDHTSVKISNPSRA